MRYNNDLQAITAITDEQQAIMMALAASINQPTLAKSSAFDNWLYVVAKLLESLQSKNQQWSFGNVTQPPSPQDDQFAATIMFTCRGVSVAPEFGVGGSLKNARIWLEFEKGRRLVDERRVDVTSSSSDSFPNIVEQMRRHIRDVQMDVVRAPKR